MTKRPFIMSALKSFLAYSALALLAWVAAGFPDILHKNAHDAVVAALYRPWAIVALSCFSIMGILAVIAARIYPARCSSVTINPSRRG